MALFIKADELTAKIVTNERLTEEAEQKLAKCDKPAGFDVAYKKAKDLVASADLTKVSKLLCYSWKFYLHSQAVFEHTTKAFNNLSANSIPTEVHEAFKTCNALAAKLIPTEALEVLKQPVSLLEYTYTCTYTQNAHSNPEARI